MAEKDKVSPYPQLCKWCGSPWFEPNVAGAIECCDCDREYFKCDSKGRFVEAIPPGWDGIYPDHVSVTSGSLARAS